MRTFFLALLLANVAFFAWDRYLAPPDPNLDPTPLARQIDPGKLPILSTTQLAKLPTKAKPAPAASLKAVPPPPKPTVPPALVACLEWGSFTLIDAPKAVGALTPLNLGTRLSQRQVQEAAGWWVYMPPQGNRRNAARKAGELKALGVNDFFVVQDEGPWHWAISLGVFRTEAAAQEHLAALRDQGVHTARVGARDFVVPKVWLQIESVDPNLQARLKEIAAGFQGSELRDCTH